MGLRKLVFTAAVFLGVILFVFKALGGEAEYIRWFSFEPTKAAMTKALEYYLEAREPGMSDEWDWIDMLAYLGAKYGGSFRAYKETDLTGLRDRLTGGERIEDIAGGMKYFDFYREAYGAVLDGFVGDYMVQVEDADNGKMVWEERFGLKVFSPVAEGYFYSHTDDFGNDRNFGYKRRHLGHDLMGSVGTPVVAVESGVVETLGWNYYGGWRIGIRSYDDKRYYYYAHLRKDRPYVNGLGEGQHVKAGDVIGYLGRTGYSRRENYNGINPPHLHLGVQIIFDESQKDSSNEIWIDLYEISKFLTVNKSKVKKDSFSNDFIRVYDFFDSNFD